MSGSNGRGGPRSGVIGTSSLTSFGGLSNSEVALDKSGARLECGLSERRSLLNFDEMIGDA